MMPLLALVPVAAALAALLAQPFRGLRGRGWRVLLLVLAPVAMLALLQAGRVPALVGTLAAGPLSALLPWALLPLAVLTALMLPLALLAALLLAREEPPGLARALAGVGVSPATLYRRVTLPALLPGLALGWAAGCVAGLVVLAPGLRAP